MKRSNIFEFKAEQWDVQHLAFNHEAAFYKTAGYQVQKKHSYQFSIAASIVLLIGVSLFYKPK
jgi:hypothetical protein